MLIEITRRGVYRSAGEMIPVGTQLEVPDDFKGWANKYRVVSSEQGKTLEVATPGPVPQQDDSELDALRAEYERITGEKPHGRKKADTLREEIEAARGGDDE